MFPPETHILIVDDTRVMLQVLRNHLTAMGFQNITEAKDAEDAWEKLRNSQTINKTIQLIISDWSMPGMGGIGLLTKVRGFPLFAQIPFIFHSAEREKENVIKAVALGVQGYLTKPCTREDLKDKIAAVYESLHRAA